MSVNEIPNWYKCSIRREDLKRLSRRENRTALLWLAGFVLALVFTGYLAILSVGTWWVVPTFLLYANLYCTSDYLLHETHHGTPFRTRWLNETVHFVVGVMGFKEATYDRWQHTNHHSYTIYPEIDLEIHAPRPPSIVRMIADAIVGLMFFIGNTLRPVLHALGVVSEKTRSFVPEPEIRKMIWSSRAWLAAQFGVIGLAFALQSWLPIVLTLGARLCGPTLLMFLAYTQHAGLEENATDHRVNTRTIYLNPVLRFFYWNINYHIEHHMFPMVPFYNLPKLHALIKDQLPYTYNGLIDVYLDVIPTLLRQRRDPSYYLRPVVPPLTAPSPVVA